MRVRGSGSAGDEDRRTHDVRVIKLQPTLYYSTKIYLEFPVRYTTVKSVQPSAKIQLMLKLFGSSKILFVAELYPSEIH